MRIAMAKTFAALGVVLAWLLPDDVYARCYGSGQDDGGVKTLELGADEIALIAAAVALAIVAGVLIVLKARRRARQEEDETESDEETP